VIQRIGAGDPRLDPYRHIGDPAWLAGHHLFVAEGRLVVERLLALSTYTIYSILVTESALGAMKASLATAPCDVYTTEPAVIEAVTGFDFHRGCLALARRPPALTIGALTRARCLVALEGVGNPDNVGGLFRTAAALRAGGLVLDPSTADPLYRKAIRTSMAATLRLPWVRMDSWPEPLQAFRAAGFRLLALTPEAGALGLDEVSAGIGPGDRFVLILGSEGAGLAKATLELADARVRIPVDPAVDSLNVVVAAGIALAHLGHGR